MNITLTRRFPNFVDTRGIDPEQTELNLDTKLEDIPFLKVWTKVPNFKRFSVSVNSEAPHCLMVELTVGEFWAIGWLTDIPDWLPVWKEP